MHNEFLMKRVKEIFWCAPAINSSMNRRPVCWSGISRLWAVSLISKAIFPFAPCAMRREAEGYYALITSYWTSFLILSISCCTF